ncbi:MAG: formate hydrogenlyase [Dehalobacter sp. 4CP]|nr:formate hydrogenlyase [Dehalobacter sp. 4CP]
MSYLLGLIVPAYLSTIGLSLLLNRNKSWNNFIINLLSAAVSMFALILLCIYLYTGTNAIDLVYFKLPISYLTFELQLDPLSALFCICLSLLSSLVAVYSVGYMKQYLTRINIGLFNAMINAFILSMFLVFTAANLVTFLFCWEIMSLISYALVVFDTEKTENSKAGLLYIIMTHLGTAFLMIGIMLLYTSTGSLEMLPIENTLTPKIRNLIFISFLIGFGVKAGIIPLHIWLPRAHPAAHSNVSSLMSGIMIKTAIYGFIRFTLYILGINDTWWGTLILILGIISSLLGVAYALMEHNYKRLLAYHSIENIGIILIGIGTSYIAYATNHMPVAALALASALFHTLNHTIFKGALFMGAGALHYSTGTKDLEELGGLMKRMPYTGLFVLLASLSISALPPFNGFVSEWLTYQSVFQLFSFSTKEVTILSILSVAALAMAGAMALACFVKFIGIAFLGQSRSPHAAKASEVSKSMLLGLGIPAFLCLGIGIFPQSVTLLLNSVIVDHFNFPLEKQIYSFVFQDFAPIHTNNTSISLLAVLCSLISILIFFYILIRFLSRSSIKRLYKTWDCGFGALSPRTQYTATGFSKPFRIVFRLLYRPTRKLSMVKGPSDYYPLDLDYTVSTEPVIEKYFYMPLVKRFTRLARKTRFYIQTGSVHIYLVYIFIALILFLVYNLIY